MLWIRNQLEYYWYTKISILCDNTTAINLSEEKKKPIQHARSKHIEIKHNFIRDYLQKGDIELVFIDT